MTDIFERLRKKRHADEIVTIYHAMLDGAQMRYHAKKRAIAYGATSTDATLFARDCAAQASSMWEKTM